MVRLKRKVTLREKTQQNEVVTAPEKAVEVPVAPIPTPEEPTKAPESDNSTVKKWVAAAVVLLAVGGLFLWQPWKAATAAEDNPATAQVTEPTSPNSTAGQDSLGASSRANAALAPSEASSNGGEKGAEPAANDVEPSVNKHTATTAKAKVADASATDVSSTSSDPTVQSSFADDESSESTESTARDVIRGRYGNGQMRKDQLGNRYGKVQRRVNQLYRNGQAYRYAR